jgi:hypothetical protein
MAQSQDLELEVKARTKDRTQCNEKCEQGSGHRRREFGEQYNSFRFRSFWIFERHNLQATSKTKRLAQDKLVDAILPTGILPKTNLIQ